MPVFTCQLSHDSANHEKKVVGKKQIEVKLDGVRVLTIVRVNGTVEQFSRNGKQFHNFQHICDEIATVTAKGQNPWGVDVVLDGEVMSNNFQDLMKQRSEGNTNIVGVMLESHIFEGNQPLDESNPDNLKYGVSITDPCVDWEETVELLRHAQQILKKS